MGTELTKDADYLICALYKEYLSRRERKVPKSQAKNFGSSVEIHKAHFPEWLPEDVDDTCIELAQIQFVSVILHQNKLLVSDLKLSNKGIIYMENRFPDGVKQVVEALKLIKEINPLI